MKERQVFKNFEEWKRWKEAQTEPTCDYVGCTEMPYWVLPQQRIFFCVKHGAEKGGWKGLAQLYGENPTPCSARRRDDQET